jgi:preprotein translocase subunit SecE
MAMNREQKRMLQKQGQLTADGAPAVQQRRPPAPRAQAERAQRTRPAEFWREVKAELRKVVMPTKSEVISYSIVVFAAVAFMTTLVGLLDYGLGDVVLRLYNE